MTGCSAWGQRTSGHINFRGTMRFGIERYGQSLLQNTSNASSNSKAG
jgi:hypothetical protein